MGAYTGIVSRDATAEHRVRFADTFRPAPGPGLASDRRALLSRSIVNVLLRKRDKAVAIGDPVLAATCVADIAR